MGDRVRGIGFRGEKRKRISLSDGGSVEPRGVYLLLILITNNHIPPVGHRHGLTLSLGLCFGGIQQHSQRGDGMQVFRFIVNMTCLTTNASKAEYVHHNPVLVLAELLFSS